MLGQMGYDENGYGGGYYYRGKRNRYNRYGGYESYSQNTEYKDAHEETPPSDE